MLFTEVIELVFVHLHATIVTSTIIAFFFHALSFSNLMLLLCACLLEACYHISQDLMIVVSNFRTLKCNKLPYELKDMIGIKVVENHAVYENLLRSYQVQHLLLCVFLLQSLDVIFNSFIPFLFFSYSFAIDLATCAQIYNEQDVSKMPPELGSALSIEHEPVTDPEIRILALEAIYLIASQVRKIPSILTF